MRMEWMKIDLWVEFIRIRRIAQHYCKRRRQSAQRKGDELQLEPRSLDKRVGRFPSLMTRQTGRTDVGITAAGNLSGLRRRLFITRCGRRSALRLGYPIQHQNVAVHYESRCDRLKLFKTNLSQIRLSVNGIILQETHQEMR